jgi:ribose transport system substrate-binding protein
VDCLAIAPADGSALIPDLLALNTKKIPLITVSNDLNADDVRRVKLDVAASIGSSNAEITQLAGQFLSRPGFTGDVAVLGGALSDPGGLVRQTGLIDALRGKRSVTVTRQVADDIQASSAVTTKMLRENPYITAIFATTDLRGLGAAAAVATLGRSHTVSVLSVGGSEATLNAIRDGRINAAVAQYPVIEGDLVARVCAKIRDKDTAFRSRIVVPVNLITKDNVVKALDSFPDPPERFADLLP